MNLLKAKQRFSVNMSRNRFLDSLLCGTGIFSGELRRDGKLVQRIRGRNGITTQGKNRILDLMFGKAAAIPKIDPWFIGLINNSPSPTLLSGDTLASHTGWDESTDYTGNRKEWNDADSSSATKGSSSVSTFVMDDTVSIYGGFICGVNTGSAGVATDEIQTITITGTPTGGTFTLTFDGQTTGAIAYNASAADIVTALNALSNVSSGDVTGGGGALPGTPVTITFTQAWGSRPVPIMTAASSLTGGTAPAIAITRSTYGQAASAGILWGTGAFDDVQACVAADELKLTYSIGF